MNITIEITGGAEIEAKLKNLGASLYRLDSSMMKIGEYLSRYYANEAFASQGQVFGATWPRLSPAYSKWKSNNFRGSGMLIRTGTMQNSFFFRAGSQSVVIGNHAPYYKYHQSTEPRTKMPRRQMAGINSVNKNMIASILRDEIKEKLAIA